MIKFIKTTCEIVKQKIAIIKLFKFKELINFWEVKKRKIKQINENNTIRVMGIVFSNKFLFDKFRNFFHLEDALQNEENKNI